MKNRQSQRAGNRLLNLLMLAGLLGLAVACSEGGDEKKEAPVTETVAPAPPAEEVNAEEQLYEEVISIHDEAMAKMGDIRRLSRQLNDSIEHTGVNPMEQEEVINLYRNRLQDLKEADDAMRQWMRRFDYESVAEAEKMDYLQQEKERIQKVDRQMDEAIGKAREAMQQ